MSAGRRRSPLSPLAREAAAAILSWSGLPLAIRRIFARRRGTIIWYHEPAPATLARHLEHISRRYRFVTLDRLVDAIRSRDWRGMPDYPLVVTIDDGHRRNYELMDVLARYGVKPVVFLCSQVVGTRRKYWFKLEEMDQGMLRRQPNARRLELLRRLVGFTPAREYPEGERQALSLSEMEAMKPHVDFGSHSRTHPSLLACTDEECRDEVFGSKGDVEFLLGEECRHFSYPYGECERRLHRMAREAGYLSARSVHPGWNGIETDLYRLRGMGVADNASINMLVAQLSGVPGLLRHLLGGSMGTLPSRKPSPPAAMPEGIEIVPFRPGHLPGVVRLGERAWGRPRSKEFYRWRYLECPVLDVHLNARRGEECLATVSAMRRRYRTGNGTVDCLEVLDWYCLPEHRGKGIGVQVMEALMKRPEPLLVVGGTPSTLRILPRLGWGTLAFSHPFILPLRGRPMGAELRRRRGVPAPLGTGLFTLGTWTLLRPRIRPPPPGGSMMLAEGIRDDVDCLYEGPLGYGAVQMPDSSQRRWIQSPHGGAGRYLSIQFTVGSRLRGWALGRVFPTEDGMEAAIVDIFTPRPALDLYEWMVSAMVSRLAEFRPGLIRARATCPVLGRALGRNRFLKGKANPVLFWPGQGAPLPGGIHMVRNTADEPFRPYAVPPDPPGADRRP